MNLLTMTHIASKYWRSAAMVALVCLTAASAHGQDDLADVSDKAHRVPGNDKLLYIEVESNPPAPEPEAGYKVLVVLPGGDGSREFNPFVKRIYKYALSPEYVVVQLVAPKWAKSEQLVWPTAKNGAATAKIAAEQFIAAAVKHVATRRKIDRRHVFALGWSSGGPAVYAASLAEKPVVTATMPTMSVFFPDQLPPLKRAAGHAYYILHSPDDQVCSFVLAKSAQEKLAAAGATTKLVEYPGGHGWQGNIFGNIAAGIQWMEAQTRDRKVEEEAAPTSK
jgi:predicted esterase